MCPGLRQHAATVKHDGHESLTSRGYVVGLLLPYPAIPYSVDGVLPLDFRDGQRVGI